MAEPKIYTKNYVSADCTINLSHTPSSFPNAYDRDKESQWVTSGANDDATLVSVEVIFKEGSVQVQRTIDRLMLINHNWKDFTVYYHDGADYQTWQAVTGETDSTTILTLASHTTGQIKIEVTATQTADAEKAIGELIACALQSDIGRDMVSYEVVYNSNATALRMGDGGVQQQYKRFSPNRFEKYEARVAFEFIAESKLEELYGIKKEGQPFLWQPESVSRPDEVFLVNWLDTWKYKYLSTNKGAGFRLEFTITEL